MLNYRPQGLLFLLLSCLMVNVSSMDIKTDNSLVSKEKISRIYNFLDYINNHAMNIKDIEIFSNKYGNCSYLEPAQLIIKIREFAKNENLMWLSLKTLNFKENDITKEKMDILLDEISQYANRTLPESTLSLNAWLFNYCGDLADFQYLSEVYGYTFPNSPSTIEEKISIIKKHAFKKKVTLSSESVLSNINSEEELKEAFDSIFRTNSSNSDKNSTTGLVKATTTTTSINNNDNKNNNVSARLVKPKTIITPVPTTNRSENNNHELFFNQIAQLAAEASNLSNSDKVNKKLNTLINDPNFPNFMKEIIKKHLPENAKLNLMKALKIKKDIEEALKANLK